MAKKIKKWSEMLEEIQSRRSRVYREGCKFVYDSGDLPDGLIGVAPGTVLALQRPHGITAIHMPGNAEDWIVIGGGSGGGGGVSITIDSSLSSTSTNPVQNKAVKTALDEKMPADQAFKTINGQSIKGSGNITPDSSLSSSSTNPVQNKVIKDALDSKVDKVSGKGLSTNDFTTTLKNKLSALPVISISGNILTINGNQFTLTPAGGGGSTTKDYYVGFLNCRSDEFAAATVQDFSGANPTGGTVAGSPTFTGTWDQKVLFVLTRKGAVSVDSATFRVVGTQTDQELELSLQHEDVTVDGTLYAVAGRAMTTANMGQDNVTITFKN